MNPQLPPSSWADSEPGDASGREEGGFILRDRSGNLNVARWPKGMQNSITLPPHPDCTVGESEIVATFHTHPNPGPDFQQEPSLTDIRGVRNDADLSGPDYEGEYVIASEWVYRIQKNGQVASVGETKAVLKIP